jgi:hypothetical protein
MTSAIGRFLRRGGPLAALALVALAAAAPRAGAQDRVYWAEGGTNYGFGYAALDGSGGGELGLPSEARPVLDNFTIDSARGRILWSFGFGIESVGLDGSGEQPFDSGSVKVGEAHSLTIDPVGRRLIWSQKGTQAIAMAGLDGGGGGSLPTGGAEVVTRGNPVVFDPASGRVYWSASADFDSTKPTKIGIGYAAIDGSGGGLIPLAAEPVGGLAIDDRGGRIYWVSGEKILSMKLDGSDQVPLATGTATLAKPAGLAIDEATRTLYWANRGAHAISFAKLDGSGTVGQVNLTGSPPGNTADLALLVAPRNLAAPEVSGEAAPGQVLSCSPGWWATDQPQARLFDAAASFAYRWTRDGAPIPGATAAALTVPAAGAAYGCTVTASNAAGATAATSAPKVVPAPPAPVPVGFGPGSGVTMSLVPGLVQDGAVKIAIENFNPFAVDGNLTATAAPDPGREQAAIDPRPFRVEPGSGTVTTLSLPTPLRDQLLADGSLGLQLATSVTDPLGAHRDVTASVVAEAERLIPAPPPQPGPSRHTPKHKRHRHKHRRHKHHHPRHHKPGHPRATHR